MYILSDVCLVKSCIVYDSERVDINTSESRGQQNSRQSKIPAHSHNGSTGTRPFAMTWTGFGGNGGGLSLNALDRYEHRNVLEDTACFALLLDWDCPWVGILSSSSTAVSCTLATDIHNRDIVLRWVALPFGSPLFGYWRRVQLGYRCSRLRCQSGITSPMNITRLVHESVASDAVKDPFLADEDNGWSGMIFIISKNFFHYILKLVGNP
jgi:hypothetical protein